MGLKSSETLPNPFSPTPGARPDAFVGRRDVLDAYALALDGRTGDPGRYLILAGSQGCGKTSLLLALKQIAANHGQAVIHCSCYTGMADDLMAGVEEQLGVDAASEVLRCFAETPSWVVKMRAFVDALSDAGRGVTFAIDDLNPECASFWDLVRVVGACVQEGRDISFLVAGDLSAVGAALEQDKGVFLSGLRRVDLTLLTSDEVAECLLRIIDGAGRSISANALELAAGAAGGYALMAQLIGYHAWAQHPDFPRISREDVLSGIEAARNELFGTLFDPQIGSLSDKDRAFLSAVAAGDGPALMADVAARLDVSTGYARMYKIRLADAGLVYSPSRGYVDLTVPLLREYLQQRTL